MKLTLQPVAVACGEDGDGLLVFVDGVLVGILVRLSEQHSDLAGAWFLEVALGPLETTDKPIFDDLDVAHAWLAAHFTERNPLDSRFHPRGFTRGGHDEP